MKAEQDVTLPLTYDELLKKMNTGETVCGFNQNKLYCDSIQSIDPVHVMFKHNVKTADSKYSDSYSAQFDLNAVYDSSILNRPTVNLQMQSNGIIKNYAFHLDVATKKTIKISEEYNIYGDESVKAKIVHPKVDLSAIPKLQPLTIDEIKAKMEKKEQVCQLSVMSSGISISCNYISAVTNDEVRFKSNPYFNFIKYLPLYDKNILTMDTVAFSGREYRKKKIIYTFTPKKAQKLTKRTPEDEYYTTDYMKISLKKDDQIQKSPLKPNVNRPAPTGRFYKRYHKMPSEITPENYQIVYDREMTALQSYINRREKKSFCEVLVPYSRIKFENMKLSDAIALSLAKTEESKKEVEFQYDSKSNTILSPIIVGCENSVLVDKELLTVKNTKTGDFHTHPRATYDNCGFSMGDIQILVKGKNVESKVGCFDKAGVKNVVTLLKKDIPEKLQNFIKNTDYVSYEQSVQGTYNPKIWEAKDEINNKYTHKEIFTK